MLKISIVKAPFPPFENITSYIKQAIKNEFYRIWLSDLPVALDPVLTMSRLKQIFHLERIGFSVLNTSLSHPFFLSRLLNSLYSLYPGSDVVIGFGAGDKLLAKELKIDWGVYAFLERLKNIIHFLEKDRDRHSLQNSTVKYAIGTQNRTIVKNVPSRISGIIFNSASINEISCLLSIKNFKEKYVATPVLDTISDLPYFNRLLELSLRSLNHEVLEALDSKIKDIVLKVKKRNDINYLNKKEQISLGYEFGLVLLDDSFVDKLNILSELKIDELLLIAPPYSSMSQIKRKILLSFNRY